MQQSEELGFAYSTEVTHWVSVTVQWSYMQSLILLYSDF